MSNIKVEILHIQFILKKFQESIVNVEKLIACLHVLTKGCNIYLKFQSY